MDQWLLWPLGRRELSHGGPGEQWREAGVQTGVVVTAQLSVCWDSLSSSFKMSECQKIVKSKFIQQIALCRNPLPFVSFNSKR